MSLESIILLYEQKEHGHKLLMKIALRIGPWFAIHLFLVTVSCSEQEIPYRYGVCPLNDY